MPAVRLPPSSLNQPLVTRQGDRIAIVSGLRTPFARQGTAFHGIPACDLAS
ncbi:hypothetical protein ACUOA5_06635, partial [Escherichia coli]